MHICLSQPVLVFYTGALNIPCKSIQSNWHPCQGTSLTPNQQHARTTASLLFSGQRRFTTVHVIRAQRALSTRRAPPTPTNRCHTHCHPLLASKLAGKHIESMQ